MKSNSLTIRIDDVQDKWLEEFSAKLGVSKANVIGWAINALADYAALHNGKPPLPIDFAEFWQIVKAKAPTEIPGHFREHEKPSSSPPSKRKAS